MTWYFTHLHPTILLKYLGVHVTHILLLLVEPSLILSPPRLSSLVTLLIMKAIDAWLWTLEEFIYPDILFLMTKASLFLLLSKCNIQKIFSGSRLGLSQQSFKMITINLCLRVLYSRTLLQVLHLHIAQNHLWRTLLCLQHLWSSNLIPHKTWMPTFTPLHMKMHHFGLTQW